MGKLESYRKRKARLAVAGRFVQPPARAEIGAAWGHSHGASIVVEAKAEGTKAQ